MLAPRGVPGGPPAAPGASDVEVLDLGFGGVGLHQRGQLGRDRLLQVLEGVEDVEDGGGRGLTPLLVTGEVLAPAGQLAVLAGRPHEALRTGDVDGELARAGAVDAVALLTAVAVGPVPVGELHALETLQLPRRHADPDGDLVEALQSPLLDLDEPAEVLGDGRREVAPGELLRALEHGQVGIGDVDRPVRHDAILDMERVYTYVYVYKQG